MILYKEIAGFFDLQIAMARRQYRSIVFRSYYFYYSTAVFPE